MLFVLSVIFPLLAVASGVVVAFQLISFVKKIYRDSLVYQNDD